MTRPGLPVADASVLVTGASSGIGAALAVELSRRGARAVGLVGRRTAKLDEVVARCREVGPGTELHAWTQDLGDVDAAEALALDAWDRFQGLDVLVNNAAIPMVRSVTDLSVDDLATTMRVDFESPVRMAMAVLPRMLERDRGMIVNVSSMGGRLGIPREAAYCAAKFALCGWSESAATDLWSTGVRVRLVIPGPIDTDIWDRPGTEPSAYDGPKEPPEPVAVGIVELIEGDRFEAYLPDMKSVAAFKTSEIDLYLEGAVAMEASTEAMQAVETGHAVPDEPASEERP
jgi:short-subunit dehydrogenase